jgi:long-chain acyl-CoA synthetase
VALVTLNEPYAKRLAKERGWTYRDFKALTQNPELSDTVRKTIAQINTGLSSYETIKNFAILPEDFTVEKGELTPSVKVKRKFADKKYSEVIDSLYTN